MKTVSERLIMAFDKGERKKFDRLCISANLKPPDVWGGLQKIKDDINKLSNHEIQSRFFYW
jgi:hypothetical protein